jgi:hypothetical protein
MLRMKGTGYTCKWFAVSVCNTSVAALNIMYGLIWKEHAEEQRYKEGAGRRILYLSSLHDSPFFQVLRCWLFGQGLILAVVFSFSSSPHSKQLWGQLSYLSNGTRGYFSRAKGWYIMKITACLHVALKLKMCGSFSSMPQPPICLHGVLSMGMTCSFHVCGKL